MEGAHESRFSREASRDPRPDRKRKGVLQDYLRGRKSLISPRVISSGKDPPVFSNRDLRKAPSSGVGLVLTYAPGNDRYQDQIFIIWMYLFQIVRQPLGDAKLAQPRILLRLVLQIR